MKIHEPVLMKWLLSAGATILTLMLVVLLEVTPKLMA